MPVNMPYPLEQLSITYQFLDEPSQKFFLDLYNGILERKDKIAIPAGMTWQAIREVCMLFENEASELISYSYNNSSVISSGDTLLFYKIAYQHCIERQDEYIAQLKDMAAQLKKPDEREGILAIQQYIGDQITYDEQSSGLFYNSLQSHLGVCRAYAQGMTALCHFAGYRCSYVSSVTHAWNIVQINGQYTYLDATWDRPRTKGVYGVVHFGHSCESMAKFGCHDIDGTNHPVFLQLPHGVNLIKTSRDREKKYDQVMIKKSDNPHIDSIIETDSMLMNSLKAIKLKKPDRIKLYFMQQLYRYFDYHTNELIRKMALLGIFFSAHHKLPQEHAFEFENCTYPLSVYSTTFNGLQQKLMAVRRDRPEKFYIIIDSTLMLRCVSDNFQTIMQILEKAGLPVYQYSYIYHIAENYIVITNAKWKLAE